MQPSCNHCGVVLVAGYKRDGANWNPSRQRRRDYICCSCDLGHGKRNDYTGPAPEKVVDPTLARIRAENRDVLSQLSNRQTGTREGFLYVITNPAWPGFVKVGRALDPEDRLGSYNTSDPHRAFVLQGFHYSANRYDAERLAHGMLRQFLTGGEWFRCEPSTALKAAREACDLTT